MAGRRLLVAWLGIRADAWAVTLATICALASILITAWSIGKHFRMTRHRQLRNYVVRILLMVPVYAITSLLCLFDPADSVMYSSVRSMYESFCLFSFMQLMLTCVDCCSCSAGCY